MRFLSVFPLSINLLVNELIEFRFRYILHLLGPARVLNEPLKYFFECVLTTLLICNVIAES
jgi:hypothetical protein